jgi:hypothetical protein
VDLSVYAKTEDIPTDEHINDLIDTALEDFDVPSGGSGIEVTGAEVGQTIVVKAVDENGKPTEWECADLKRGWKLVGELTLEEDVQQANVRLSKPVADEIMVQMQIVASSTATAHGLVKLFFNGDANKESYEYINGVYIGTKIDVFFVREYYENWICPIVTSFRYGGDLHKRRSWTAGSNTTITTVNVFAGSTNALLGIGTTVKVYARG